MTPPSSNPLAPPPSGVGPPPRHPGKKQKKKKKKGFAGKPCGTKLHVVFYFTPCLFLTARPPPGSMVMPPPPLGPGSQKEADSSQSESEPDVDGVMLVLSQALAACRQAVKVSFYPFTQTSPAAGSPHRLVTPQKVVALHIFFFHYNIYHT